MLMLDCQHVDCYMIYRIARYFDQLGFFGSCSLSGGGTISGLFGVGVDPRTLGRSSVSVSLDTRLWSNQIFSHGMVVSDSLSHFVLAFLFMRNKLK